MEGIRFSSSKKEEDPATINAVDNHTNIVSARSSTGQNIPAFSTDQATCSSVSPRHDGDCEAGTHGVLLRKDCGRERLRKHIEEVAGRVMIPDTWGQENLLKDWIDSRESLVAERRRGSSPGLRIASSCQPIESIQICGDTTARFSS
ncbi:protein BIC [Salix suchowensis]|nr:protein BIC [Salix suchowensis]